MRRLKCLSAGWNFRSFVALLTTILTLGTANATAADHVLPLSELHAELAGKGAAQEADRAVLQRFFSESRVREVLNRASFDSDQIARSVMLLDASERASLAQRVRAAEEQLSGGEMKDAQVTLIIMCVTAFAIIAILVLAFK